MFDFGILEIRWPTIRGVENARARLCLIRYKDSSHDQWERLLDGTWHRQYPWSGRNVTQ